jgi:hypothetical protein
MPVTVFDDSYRIAEIIALVAIENQINKQTNNISLIENVNKRHQG